MKPLHVKSAPVFIPFIFSLCLYCSIVFAVFFYLNHNDTIVKRYTSKKDNFLQVSIVQKPRIQTPPKVEQKIEKTPIKNEKPKEEMKTTKKQNIGIKSLFGKTTKDINITKLPSKNKTVAAKISRLKPAEKVKSTKASKLANSLNFKTSQPTKKFASSGEYDEFRGKVQEILTNHWNTMEDLGIIANAHVKVQIDKNGNFSYNIVNLSYNNVFNQKLVEFLEQMKKVEFPKNTYGISFNEPIKFSSKWSDENE